MPEARQLDLLESLAKDRSDALAVQLAAARRALDAAVEQHAMLERYEAGYRDQIGARLEAAIDIEALRGHRRFLDNIGRAVRQQDAEVARRRAQAEACERAWQDSERRRQGFQVIGEGIAQRAQRAADRAAQKQNDEFATRKAARDFTSTQPFNGIGP